MLYKLLADVVLVLHLLFILTVLIGALLVFKWPRFAWLHIPVALWGMSISFFGWVCPLTPLENYFRTMAGQQGFTGGFIGHYLLPMIYPGQLTRGMAIGMGVFVLLWNGLFYSIVLYRLKHSGHRQEAQSG